MTTTPSNGTDSSYTLELQKELWDIARLIQAQQVLDLEGYLKKKHNSLRQVRHFRVPLFLLRKMRLWILQTALLNFAKVCNPPWFILQFIEYLPLASLETCKNILLWRLHHISISPEETLSLSASLNRVSLFQEYDTFLGDLIQWLPDDILDSLKRWACLGWQWILFKQLISGSRKKTTENTHCDWIDGLRKIVAPHWITWSYSARSKIWILHGGIYFTVNGDEKCTVFNGQRTVVGASNVDDIQKWLRAPFESDIIILRGHWIPAESIELIKKSRAKMVIFWWCQGIDLFLSEIAYRKKNGDNLDWVNWVIYVGTTRLGRACYNDAITDLILSHVKQWHGIIKLDDITEMTHGNYTSFMLS